MRLEGLRRWPHAVLLAATVAMLVAQPLIARAGAVARPVYDALMLAVAVLVLRVVLARPGERRAGLALLGVAAAANFSHYALPAALQAGAQMLFHAGTLLFLAHAVVAILGAIFRSPRIGADDVCGAAAGYLLAAMAWSHLYALCAQLAPGSFEVAPAIVAELGDWHLRRALFEYYSLTTLTSIGWSEVTPVRPPATTFAWLEVVGGQFYMAVVVATLVAQRMTGPAPGDRGGPDA